MSSDTLSREGTQYICQFYNRLGVCRFDFDSKPCILCMVCVQAQGKHLSTFFQMTSRYFLNDDCSMCVHVKSKLALFSRRDVGSQTDIK